MKILCLHGISRDAWNRYADQGNWQYDVVACGFKYNLSDIQSAIGIHQLRKQERFVAARAAMRPASTTTRSADLDELELPPDDPSCRHAWHLYAHPVAPGQARHHPRRSSSRSSGRGTSARASISFRFQRCRSSGSTPKTRGMTVRTPSSSTPRLVSLPLYPGMSERQIDLRDPFREGDPGERRAKRPLSPFQAAPIRPHGLLQQRLNHSNR